MREITAGKYHHPALSRPELTERFGLARPGVQAIVELCLHESPACAVSDPSNQPENIKINFKRT